MRKKTETDISSLKSQISMSRKSLLSKYSTGGKRNPQDGHDSRSAEQLRHRNLSNPGDHRGLNFSAKEQYDTLNIKLKEKAAILAKIEANISQNQTFRKSIYNVLKTLMSSIVG